MEDLWQRLKEKEKELSEKEKLQNTSVCSFFDSLKTFLKTYFFEKIV